jgi:hypothetical protein
VSFDASGTLPVPSGLQNEFIEPELHDRAHAAGVKVLLLLGGDFNALQRCNNSKRGAFLECVDHR